MPLTFADKSPRNAPQQVLDAAAICFMEKGYAGSTLDDVARHMGATKGRIYHYFNSKSELMHAVRKRAMDINFAAIRDGFDSNLPPAQKFRLMADAHALNMMAEQPYQRALFDSLHTHMTRDKAARHDAIMDEFIGDRRAFEDMFREVLEQGKASGAFRFKTLSIALHTVITILNSSIYWYSPRPDETDKDRRQIASELVDMAQRALGATTP
ncbi:MAG: TetR/AcrR family transcriptional regulator [Rhodobacterales bacterium]|nr:hypothetical protein [Paracoccaceae bacterium]